MRVKGGPKTRWRRKKWLKLAKGYWGAKSRLYKIAKQTVIKALTYAYRDRKVRKREFRRLWILRINAAVRSYGLKYSEFIHGLKLANVGINRKMLAELAINQPEVFKYLVDIAREALLKKVA
ncbi:MAG: 50S ribosomal protein L20 [Thermosulfidibacteraceae bacterium]|jgi:large subunit ribosomal protein L20